MYCLAVAVVTAAQFIVYQSGLGYSSYFAVYWSGQTILVFLSCLAVFEIFREMLRSYAPISSLGFAVFVSSLGALMVIAILWISVWTGGVVHVVLALQDAIRFVQLGLLLVALGFAVTFRLRWNEQAFGIAVGFGIYGASALAFLLLYDHRLIAAEIVQWADPIAYNLVCFLWLAYLFDPERQPVARVLPSTPITEWNQALGELLQR